MSTFALKIMALTSMIIDHSAHVLYSCGLIENYELYLLLRGLGRIAFPVYAFLLVKGFAYTKDKKKYLSRMMALALISQIPFTLCFAAGNYSGDVSAHAVFNFAYGLEALLLLIPLAVCVYYFRAEGFALLLAAFLLLPGIRLSHSFVLLDGEMNVFYTLAVALSLLCCAEKLKAARNAESLLLTAAVMPLLIVIQPHADYALRGILLIFTLYICADSLWAQILTVLVWSALQYMYSGGWVIVAIFVVLAAAVILPMRNRGKPALAAAVGLWCLACWKLTTLYFCVLPVFAALSVFSLMYYNHKPGLRLKTTFYAAYPVHLTILFIISSFL